MRLARERQGERVSMGASPYLIARSLDFSPRMDHIDYIVRLIGTDHVGLGSDFDGIESPPQQLDDVTTYPLITRELEKRGYKAADIKKILGGNFIRVFKANSEGVVTR